MHFYEDFRAPVMRNKNITVGLIHSPESSIGKVQNFGLEFSPVWAYVLATYIKEFGIEPKLFDLNQISINEIEECEIFFFSGINQDIDALIKTSKYCKKKFPNVEQYLGGPIAWSLDKAGELDRLNNFDHICIGDGEILVPLILDNHLKKIKAPKILREEKRFAFNTSKEMSRELISNTYSNYYGGVIEVSRGCPFLCEFCDIRVIPDNNRNHSKQIELIIDDLNYYRLKGVSNFQLACDNLIGDLDFAKELVGAIIKNNLNHDWSPSFYTWLTINLSNHHDLMTDMRVAGFDIIFIGIESFNNNTLLETAKLQNTKGSLVDSILKIQSYGFIIAAGLIFGFDSDAEDVASITLDGIIESNLLSGEPSLLSALPGTPLYRRMRLSGRLRNSSENISLSRQKFVTNIKYLMPKEALIKNYLKFFRVSTTGKFHYKRLSGFYKLIVDSEVYVNKNRSSSISITSLLKSLIKNPLMLKFYLNKVTPIVFSSNLIYLLKAINLTFIVMLKKNIGFGYFFFWLYIWSNNLTKYKDMNIDDFDIESVPCDFNIMDIIPHGYREEADEKIPENKINAQHKSTIAALRKVINLRLET